MKTLDTIGKAIWRNPGDNKVYYLSNDFGYDEFIIAPYNKNESILSIRGSIIGALPSDISQFFNDLELKNVPIAQSTPKEYYLQSIEKAIKAINFGSLEKVVLARQYCIEKKTDPHLLFNHLTVEYPGAFVYCFILDNGTCMIGATPETLLTKKGPILTTEALGGTEQAYGYSEKEYEEHRQIIRDITSKLDELAYNYQSSEIEIKKAGNVAHLSTLYTLKSKSLTADLALLETLHPTAAICGLPYQSANAFILDYEDFDRHYYAGYLGTKHGDDFNFFVNLRCAEITEQNTVLYAGAGINKDSIPENEWIETSHKLDTLLRLII